MEGQVLDSLQDTLATVPTVSQQLSEVLVDRIVMVLNAIAIVGIISAIMVLYMAFFDLFVIREREKLDSTKNTKSLSTPLSPS